MSSFNRRQFLLLSTLPVLAGCGFEPTYGSNGSASGLLNNTVIDAPTDNNTYLIVRELEDRLGRTSVGTYGLTLSVKTNQRSTGRTVSGVTSRYDIEGEATYALRNLSTGEVLASGKTQNYTGYSATGTPVATTTSETDAYERLMVILADQVVTELMAWSSGAAL